MRQQLIQYVDLLFAGAADCEDIKQEILQNTLDRYDDLIAEGKVPQAAYRLAITGIGDLSEILGTPAATAPAPVAHRHIQEEAPDTPRKKLMRAVAIGLYILCPIPMFLTDGSTVGLCCLLIIVAIATVLIILGGRKDDDEEERAAHRKEEDPLRKSINSIIWAIGLALYFLVSFTTGAWHITWVIFLITGAVEGLAKAILDLKEASNHEN